ncbi:hypothetical protein Q4E40_11115 [Pontibacter sp. BT731]|uniref:hypothetical protein n=1 Tax=Pontibacter coccineus TaxID=3063328 RepID=UPI0026E1240D|nr:hypothetical protein [Pontibacter sp. BT731]MDO6390677.1 hypothetical protein [Pontibacter sp. BT731]
MEKYETVSNPGTKAMHPNGSPIPLIGIMKFTFLAALLAMFGDAAIAHAMLWGNDPYWTYWITDGLLMSTVFGLGTAFFGAGVGRGAILTAVHIFLLTTYYWILSPIGLPGHGEWLDLERTWLTGLPVHFGIYYLGYLVALWLWRKHKHAKHTGLQLKYFKEIAIVALIMAAGIVVILGLVQTILKSEFPGATWFIVRLAVSFPFIFAWWAIVGKGRTSYITGGVMLAFLLSAYTHYLAPIGLPNPSLRIFEKYPPSSEVHWLSYRDEFLIILPITLIVAIIAFFIGNRRIKGGGAANATEKKPAKIMSIGLLAAAIAIIIVGFVVFKYTGPEVHRVTISASSAATLEQGQFYSNNMAATTAAIEARTENANTHRTPLPPHDKVDINATVTTPDGLTWNVVASQPIISDPLGRFTTWAGVGYDVWHHGRSGIGTSKLPDTHSDVAVYALGNVMSDGRVIASGVPVHLMTTEREGGRLELHVGDTSFPVSGIPDGHFRVVWANYTSDYSRTFDFAKYAWGGIWLITLLLLALAAAKTENPDNMRA